MRTLVITLILLVAVAAGVLVTIPRLVDWNDYREQLIRQAEAMTGTTVTIDGRIDFRLLPRPTLTVGETEMAGNRARGSMLLRIDRLDLQLRALPLLRGDLQVRDVRVVRPVLRLDQSPDQEQRQPPAGSDPVWSLIALRPHHLTVVDGRVLLQPDQPGGRQLDAINIETEAASPAGPFSLHGSFATAEEQFGIDARLGRLSPDGVGSLQLELATEEGRSGPASLTFSGAVWWDPAQPRLRGEVTLIGDDARSSIATLSGALGRELPRLPAWLERPFEISGDLRLERGRLQLEQLRLLLAEMEAAGGLDLALGPDPSIALDLRVQRLTLSDPLHAGLADLAPLAALPAGLRGEIDLSVAALHYRDRRVGRIRLRLSLHGDGEVTVQQASAILPGQTDVRFEGRLTGVGEAVTLRGDVSAVTGDLGAVLTWLDLRPPGVAAGRLRTLSLSSAIAIDRDAIRLSEADLRIDATQLRGSLRWATGALAPGRPRLEAAVAIDRLDLDAYRADLRPADVARVLRRTWQTSDAVIATRIERLTWRGLHLRELAFDLRTENGQLVLRDASLETAGEAKARAEGEIDLESGAFRWSAELRAARPVRLLRRLGLAAPVRFARLGPLTLNASASGRPAAFDLEIEIDDGRGRLTAAGTAGWDDGGPRYDLDLELTHPDYVALFRTLGVRTPALDRDAPAPLTLTGRAARDGRSGHTVVGSARLGAMSVTGLFSWRPQTPRPSVEVQLSVGEPRADVLIALLDLAGASPPPSMLANPVLGNWPRNRLRLDWLSTFDGELELSAKGGLAGGGLELQARLRDRKLRVERCLVDLWHGTLSAELTLDVGRRLPFLTAALELRGIDAAPLAARMGLAPVIEGALDLDAELTAAGDSPYDLVRSLLGEVDVTIGAGQLRGYELATIAAALGADNEAGAHDAAAADDAGRRARPLPELGAPLDRVTGRAALPFTDLAGHFTLERGIATAESVQLDVAGAKGRLVGVVDLLLWAGDLSLELEDPERPEQPIRLDIVGPLQRPQTRLVVPEGALPARAP